MSAFREFGDLHINLDLVCYVYFNDKSADVYFTNGTDITLCGDDCEELKKMLLVREKFGKG